MNSNLRAALLYLLVCLMALGLMFWNAGAFA